MVFSGQKSAQTLIKFVVVAVKSVGPNKYYLISVLYPVEKLEEGINIWGPFFSILFTTSVFTHFPITTVNS